MMLKFIIKPILMTGVALCCCAGSIFSQEVSVGERTSYEKAVDLYEKGLPSDADAMFRKAWKEAGVNDVLLQANIAYYRGMCAIQLDEPNAEQMINDFLIDYSFYPKKNDLVVALADRFFDNKNYRKCVYWYGRIDNSSLTQEQQMEHKFKLAYSYFQTKNMEKARGLFAEVKNVPGQYAVPATYYYSHCSYMTGSYDEALKGFQSIKNDDRFSELSAYYILHIYFLKKDYANAIAYGTDLLPKVVEKQQSEIARILAECYLMTEKYDKALEYFAIYQASTNRLERSDYYFSGFVSLKLKKYDEAILNFSKVSGGRDSIAQSAQFYTADAYLKQGKKQEAMDIFQKAMQGKASEIIAEDAAFNYAKLALELNRDSTPLNDFRKKYPNSRKNEELKNYMITLYTGAGEYETALNMLHNIPSPTDKDRADLQQISFLYGKSLYDKGDYNGAQKAFATAKKHNKYNKEVAALTNFWNAENLFALKNYQAAVVEYEQFANAAGLFNSGLSRNSNEYKIAHYNNAYAYFKQQQYDKSVSWFRKYINAAGADKAHSELITDSYNRIGDCYFVQHKYEQAIDSYDDAIDRKTAQADYAMYQLGLAYGMTNKASEKIVTLTNLEKNMPASSYAPAALYEIGRTYVRDGKFTEANTVLQKLIGKYPQSPYYPKALNEVGLISMNIGEPKRAIDYYKRVLERFPNTSEDYQDALNGLKSAYTELKDIDGYFAYTEKLGVKTGTISDDREEMMFTSGQAFYTENNCDKTIETFEKFLQLYAGGIYAVRAKFYLGDCYYKKEDFRKAADNFAYTMNQPQNSFTELAMLGNARSELALKNYEAAIVSYEKLIDYSAVPGYLLEAKTGIMRAEFELGRYKQAANAAQTLLNAENKTPELQREAQLCQAKSYKALGAGNEAVVVCTELSANKKTKEGAEAAYMLIEMEYEAANYTDMETHIFAFADSGTPYQYWVARSFIILGDSYMQRKDTAQAKATFQSLLDGYKNTADGIIDMVKERMAKLK